MIRKNNKGINEIALINIFASIQGEGYAAGKPTVFIRTFGCNLRCSFCFAKDQSGNYPYVITEYGTIKHLNEVKIGDRILTKDPDTNNTFITTVTNVMSREAEPDTIRKVEFGKVGYNSFNVTEEHPFFTNKWQAIKDIKVGELVKRTTNSNIIKYLVEDLYREQLSNYTKLAIDTYTNNHKDSHNFNNKNGMYSESVISRNFGYAKNGLLEMDNSKYPLAAIWGYEKLVVHHIDGNHANDSVENMVVIPKRIHDKLHARGNNFSKNYLSDFIELTKNNVRRKNIKYGSTVINIETESHSYYVKCNESGDAILVHNCDTKECWSKENMLKVYPERKDCEDPFKWMTAKEIFNLVEEIEKDYIHKSICLTGGEPLMEENKEFMLNELLPLFVDAGYDVGIETDGGIDYTDYKAKFGDAKIINAHGDRQGITIIADYKLPHSKMTKLMKKENFKLYSDMDLVKMVISNDKEDWKELDWVVNESGTKASIYLSPCFGEVDMHKIPDYILAHSNKHIKAQLQIHKFFWSPTKKDV